jgi:lipopolysaccharide/colanic/teichoic acid biosynthesis glycosyltransferase
LDPKRVFDATAGGVGLLLTLPIQAGIAGLIRGSMGKPVLFRQVRPGLHGQTFELLKFRTMRPADPASGPAGDDSRLTPLGRFLRSTSLDELPSLINVVRGDMSLVGPRPLLPQYLDRYTPEQARRHEVRPGLTGLAQISGRNAITWADRLRLDVTYVDTHTFTGDLRILWRTVAAVVRRDGISAPGEATMPEFMGTDSVGTEPTLTEPTLTEPTLAEPGGSGQD